MALPNIFTYEVSDKIIQRIQALTASSQPIWGKMGVAQMLAHCAVTYEMLYETKHAKPNFFMRLMLKAFVKSTVVGEAPYKHDSRTAPAFIITDARDFEKEKARLIAYIRKTQLQGESSFEGKESLSFGPLSKTEWNNLLYKHLDHHLSQFGV
jgi:Protein of unknown function (DUF1569)